MPPRYKQFRGFISDEVWSGRPDWVPLPQGLGIGVGHPRWGRIGFDVHVEAASGLLSSPGAWVAYAKAPLMHPLLAS